MNILLRKPAKEDVKEIETFRGEIYQAGDKDAFAGCFGLDSCESVEAWIEKVELQSRPECCPKDRVPSDVYLAVRVQDNRLVGVIDLRHHIDHPVLREWGGHIGYSVRPGERGKGYAKEMLRQNLLNAKSLGLKRVMITCDSDNSASEKTILANGGVLEKEIFVEGTPMKRYWIEL